MQTLDFSDREYWSAFDNLPSNPPEGCAPFQVVPVDVFLHSSLLKRLQSQGLRDQRNPIQNLVWLPVSRELANASGFMHFAPYGTIPGYVAMVKYFVEQAEAEFNKSKPNFNFLGMGSSKLAAAEKHAARQIIGYSNELKMMLINSKHPGWAMMGHS